MIGQSAVSRRKRLEKEAREAGLYVSSWSPGDGVTRYRFFKGTSARSYFSGGAIYSVAGLIGAENWLSGYRTGKHTQ
jgi:hypothetical protein